MSPRAYKEPSSACARQISSPSTTTFRMVSTSSSSSLATGCLANADLELLLHQLPRLADRDAVQHLPEEAVDDHPLRGGGGDAPALQVEEVLGVDWRHGGAVRAAH